MAYSISRTQPTESFAIEGELSSIYFREFTLTYLPPGKYKVSAAIIDDSRPKWVKPRTGTYRKDPLCIEVVAHDVSDVPNWTQLMTGVKPSSLKSLDSSAVSSTVLTTVTFGVQVTNSITCGSSSVAEFEIKEGCLIGIEQQGGWRVSANHPEYVMFNGDRLGFARNLCITVEKVG